MQLARSVLVSRGCFCEVDDECDIVIRSTIPGLANGYPCWGEWIVAWWIAVSIQSRRFLLLWPSHFFLNPLVDTVGSGIFDIM